MNMIIDKIIEINTFVLVCGVMTDGCVGGSIMLLPEMGCVVCDDIPSVVVKVVCSVFDIVVGTAVGGGVIKGFVHIVKVSSSESQLTVHTKGRKLQFLSKCICAVPILHSSETLCEKE